MWTTSHSSPRAPRFSHISMHLLLTLSSVSPHTNLFLASLYQSFRSEFNCHFSVEPCTNLSCLAPHGTGYIFLLQRLTDDCNILLADLPSQVNHGLSISSESLVPSTILGFHQATRNCLLNKRTSDWGLWLHHKMSHVIKEENKVSEKLRRGWRLLSDLRQLLHYSSYPVLTKG